MPEITLRPCAESDIGAVLALWRVAEAVPRPTDHRGALLLRLQRDRPLFQLAWDGPVLVGSLMGGWDGWRGNMYRLAVHPVYRRQSVARRLIATVEVELRALGAERITSPAFVGEPGAATLWTAAGYLPDPSTARYAKSLV